MNYDISGRTMFMDLFVRFGEIYNSSPKLFFGIVECNKIDDFSCGIG